MWTWVSTYFPCTAVLLQNRQLNAICSILFMHEFLFYYFTYLQSFPQLNLSTNPLMYVKPNVSMFDADATDKRPPDTACPA